MNSIQNTKTEVRIKRIKKTENSPPIKQTSINKTINLKISPKSFEKLLPKKITSNQKSVKDREVINIKSFGSPEKLRIQKRNKRKGNWSCEEDELLLKWVSENGCLKWTDCSKYIPNRCGKQCRERWVNILNPEIRKGDWSEGEQSAMFERLKEVTTSWSLMASVLPGRTENAIKNYFYSSLRRLKSNPVIHLIKDIHKEGKTLAEEVSLENVFLNSQMNKLNFFTRKICRFLLDKKIIDFEFKEFLLGVLFGELAEDGERMCALNEFKMVDDGEEKIKEEKAEKVKQGNVKGGVDRDVRAVVEVLRVIADGSNFGGFLPFFRHFEDVLMNHHTVQENGEIVLKVNECWECVGRKIN